LSALLEAVEVGPGIAGAVATLAVTVGPTGPPLRRLAALLNGTLARVAYRALWAAQAMNGGSTPVTRGRLGALLVPAVLLKTATTPDSTAPVAARVAELARAADKVAGDPMVLPSATVCRSIVDAARDLRPLDGLVQTLDALLADSTITPSIAIAAVDLVSAVAAPDAWATLLDMPSRA
jgi:hypothetical protein